MPTSDMEARRITEIVSEYIDNSAAQELFTKLNTEIGMQTDNDSLRESLAMLCAYINKIG
jgi:hypothetical protein